MVSASINVPAPSCTRRGALDELAQQQGDDQGELIVALSIMPHVGMLPHALRRFPLVREPIA